MALFGKFAYSEMIADVMRKIADVMRRIAEVMRKIAEVKCGGNVFSKVHFSEVFLFKVHFCEIYPTCVSSKLCEFIFLKIIRIIYTWKSKVFSSAESSLSHGSNHSLNSHSTSQCQF